MDTKTKTSPIITAIATAAGFVIGSVLVHSYFNKPATIERALVKASSEINRNLPMMVDKDTRLDTTGALPENTLVYRYTLVNLTASEVPKERVEALRPGIIANYKSSGDMKGFREGNVTMKYQYSDKNGVFIAEISVSPKDF